MEAVHATQSASLAAAEKLNQLLDESPLTVTMPIGRDKSCPVTIVEAHPTKGIKALVGEERRHLWLSPTSPEYAACAARIGIKTVETAVKASVAPRAESDGKERSFARGVVKALFTGPARLLDKLFNLSDPLHRGMFMLFGGIPGTIGMAVGLAAVNPVLGLLGLFYGMGVSSWACTEGKMREGFLPGEIY